jgi:hypothetical protein
MCFPSADVKCARVGNKYQYNEKLIKKNGWNILARTPDI